MTDQIVTTLDSGILTVEMRRPDKKNALTAAMYGAMADAIHGANMNAGVRVLLICGQPDCFTAGNDLKDFLANPPSGDDSPVFRFLRAIAAAEKPMVGAVAGVAVGIGTTMLLHCDLVVAGESARFQLPFVNLGLCPEAASSLLLPMVAGYQRAAELLLLGEIVGASEARDMGFVNRVVPDSEVLEQGLTLARRLAALPAASLRITKALMKRSLASSIREAMTAEGAEFRQRLDSPEAKEAFTAFLEKRRPDFSRFS